jgi:hypothetical protein
MKTLLTGIAFALVMAFTSQAFATDLPDCPKGAWKHGLTSVRTFRQTHNDQPLVSDAASWHPTLILLLGAIVGFILWTPLLPWLFESLGLD